MPSEDLKEFAVTVHKDAPLSLSASAPARRIPVLDYAIDILVGIRKPSLFLMAFILSIYFVVTISVMLLGTVYPVVQSLESKAVQLVSEIYPENLEITIKDGVASTNVTEPYYITIRKNSIEDILSLFSDDRDNSISRIRVLTIDTQGKAEDFERYQTLALLTERNLVYFSDDEVKISSLQSVGNVTITRKNLLDKIHEVNKDGKIVKIISTIIIISPLVLLIGSISTSFMTFLFLTLAVYFFIIKTYQLPVNFSRTFRFTAFLTLIVGLAQQLMILIPDWILATQPIEGLSLFFVILLAYIVVQHGKGRIITQPSV